MFSSMQVDFFIKKWLAMSNEDKNEIAIYRKIPRWHGATEFPSTPWKQRSTRGHIYDVLFSQQGNCDEERNKGLVHEKMFQKNILDTEGKTRYYFTRDRKKQRNRNEKEQK